ncbi:hypothetical protein CDV55_100397 [Aspergillus turcosus]|uniref:Uncharacterized protein n=1 Tax=Aspergillus turcosus TaxID=1245748 RepID=A0A229XDE4_9EURO|nr:hypothetical protein CDV55_100397 [Aspergillus turcosus]RLL99950.1 hypothetical protein CFD26_105484 [Aspergillus turcosus]
MANRKSKRIAQKMATVQEGGAGDSSVQPEGSLTAEVSGTVPPTLAAADGSDEAAVHKAHPSPPLKRKDISPCDESEDLDQQLNDLRTENLRLQERYHAISLSMQKEQSRALWIGAYGPVVKEFCKRLGLELSLWTLDYAIEDVNTVEPKLSASEKQSIITSLDGYCKQEDWESLVKRFPAKIQKGILQLFAHTLWTKHLFEDVFMKPFFYFDFYEQEEMTSTAGEPDSSLPTKLQNMYQMFRTVDEAQAQLWRSDTVRLANSIVPLREEANCAGKSTIVGPEALVLGERSKQARRSAVERLVSSILDGPIRLMLRKLSSPKEADRRNEDIIDMFCRAAEMATTCWADRSLWEIRGLDKVVTFHWHSKTLKLHHLQFVDKNDPRHPRLDGKAVLVVMQPPLYRLGNHNLQYHIDRMIAKGLVIVEDPAPT